MNKKNKLAWIEVMLTAFVNTAANATTPVRRTTVYCRFNRLSFDKLTFHKLSFNGLSCDIFLATAANAGLASAPQEAAKSHPILVDIPKFQLE